MMRKGFTKGSGRIGYYNVMPKDPLVHRQSARGIKQPQCQKGGFIPLINPLTITFAAVIGVELTRSGLTKLNRWYMDYLERKRKAKGISIEKAHTQALIDARNNPDRFKLPAEVDYDALGGKKGRCDHVLDDEVGYGVHCIKCGYAPPKTPSKRCDCGYHYKGEKCPNCGMPEKLGGKMTPELKEDFEVFRKDLLVALKDKNLNKEGRQKLLKMLKVTDAKLKGGKYRLFVRPEGSEKLVGTTKYFKDREKAETFANIETAAGMGEIYEVMEVKPRRKNGGKLSLNKKGMDVFDLPIENAIYVPSTDKGQKQVSEPEFRRRIKETEDFLSGLYGGFTRFEDVGGFYDDDSKRMIKEKGAKVVSFASEKAAKSKRNMVKLKKWILEKQKEWGQISIGYENEGDLYYLSEAKDKKGHTSS